MKAEDKVLAIVMVAVVAVACVGGAYFLLTDHPPPSFLPIPAGTTVRGFYNVSFTVSGGLGRLVGAWYATHGGDVWVYPLDSPPSGIYEMPCMGPAPWSGTVNVSLVPETYTILFEPGGLGGSISITQAIRVVYPGDPPGTNATILSGGC